MICALPQLLKEEVVAAEKASPRLSGVLDHAGAVWEVGVSPVTDLPPSGLPSRAMDCGQNVPARLSLTAISSFRGEVFSRSALVPRL